MPEKILIVDDDLETLRLIGVMLQRQGYEIAAANTGEMAVSMAKKENPDLIVLDIMMPVMDGYRVAKEIRQDPDTAQIPILMFTAKSQVDDKIAGYDAGADDYLTKPVHPAELSAHVKSLLARSARTEVPVVVEAPGHVIGITGCKGGLGASTLALNLAVEYFNVSKKEVLAIELRPGMGSWGIELDIADSYGLEKILALTPEEITAETVEKYIVRTTFGIKLLIASNKTRQIDFTGTAEKLIRLIDVLNEKKPILILDIGDPYLPGYDEICARCQELIILTDAFQSTVLRTRKLIGNIQMEPPKKSRNLEVILYNHLRSDLMLTKDQIDKMLPGNPVRMMFPSVPEQVFQANQKDQPLVTIQPEGLYAQQISELTRLIHSRAGA